MFSRIRINGLGPHDALDLALNAKGPTTITGPSEAGKSTLVDAMCVTLWGCDAWGAAFPVEAIHDEHSRLEVELETERGAELRRTMTKSRSTQRQKRSSPGDDRLSWRSEQDWAGALKGLGNKHKLLPIMSPYFWQELVRNERGRPFRDYLASVLADRSGWSEAVKSQLSETHLGLIPAEALGLNLKAAKEQRHAVKQSANSADGALRQAKQALHNLGEAKPVVDAVPADEVTKADKVLADASRWAEHKRAAERHAADLERFNKANEGYTAAEAAYKAALADLGEPPAAQQVPVKSTRESLRKARSTMAEAEASWTAALSAFSRHEVPEAPAAPDVEKWSHVGTHWEGPGCAVSATDDFLLADCEGMPGAPVPWAIVEHLQAERAFDEVALEAAVAEQERLTAAKDKAGHAVEVARKVFQQTEEAHDAAQAQADALADYQSRKAALQAPQRPGQAPKAPMPPGVPQPNAEAVEAAQRTKVQAMQAQGAAQAEAGHRERLNAQLVKAEEARTKAHARVEAYEALVAACVAAPNILLEQGLDRLNDLLAEDGVKVIAGAADCTVHIDGRTYTRASTGRRVRAGLALRLALRKLARCSWLPVFVDDTQAWSGSWPEANGPVVYLMTRGQEEIRSSAAVGGAA